MAATDTGRMPGRETLLLCHGLVLIGVAALAGRGASVVNEPGMVSDTSGSLLGAGCGVDSCNTLAGRLVLRPRRPLSREPKPFCWDERMSATDAGRLMEAGLLDDNAGTGFRTGLGILDTPCREGDGRTRVGDADGVVSAARALNGDSSSSRRRPGERAVGVGMFDVAEAADRWRKGGGTWTLPTPSRLGLRVGDTGRDTGLGVVAEAFGGSSIGLAGDISMGREEEGMGSSGAGSGASERGPISDGTSEAWVSRGARANVLR